MTTRDNAIAELHFGEKHIRLNNLNPWSNSKHKGVKMNIEESINFLEPIVSCQTRQHEEIANHIKQLIEFAKSMQWQSIETAPKDGTEIRIGVNLFHESKITDASGRVGSGFCDAGAYWFDFGIWKNRLDQCLLNPTHWQPLPQLPKEEK